jgi:hypothetical protein
VICGTDTLGVGVNIPIRTVVFNRLAKFDGRKTAILPVRDFQQIAGRAGRKGFDDRGWVVAQAPEQVIELRKAAGSGKKRRPRAAPKGEVRWSEETFRRLVERPPEMLESRFRVSASMVLDLLQRDAEVDDPQRGNFHSLRQILGRCHEDERGKRRLLSQAAALVRSLYRTGVLVMQRDARTRYLWVAVDQDLQKEFSLHQALSLFLVEALEGLDPQHPEYALDLLSLVESVLEDPVVILRRQVDHAKDELVARMKGEGVPYEERMARLEEVTHPKPGADFLYQAFQDFRQRHPWVAGEMVRPKSIGREMFEGFLAFSDYVRRYGLQRSEGVLLRYLSQLYKTLVQGVPERARTQEVYDVLGFLRTLLERTDTSLLEEWESLLHPELRLEREEQRGRTRESLRAWELFHDPRAFASRVRAELHALVHALARRDWEEAAAAVRRDGGEPWPAERLEQAMAPFFAEHEHLHFDHAARQSHHTRIEEVGPRVWRVFQTLLDAQGEGFWCLEGEIDLSPGQPLEGPLVRLLGIGR